MRGPLAPPPVPIAATRRESFEDLVLDAAEKIDSHLMREHDVSLAEVEFTVEDIPVFAVGDEPAVVPFGRATAGTADRRPSIVIYRRTIELRSEAGEERAELVHDAVVEQVADLLDIDPDEVDPGFD